MTNSMSIIRGVPQIEWGRLLKGLEQEGEHKAIYCGWREGRSVSYNLLTDEEIKERLSRPEVWPRLSYNQPGEVLNWSRGFYVYSKLSFREITQQNASYFDKFPSVEIGKNFIIASIEQSPLSGDDALHKCLEAFNTVLDSQVRIHSRVLKKRCFTTRIICYVQDFLLKFWNGNLYLFASGHSVYGGVEIVLNLITLFEKCAKQEKSMRMRL